MTVYNGWIKNAESMDAQFKLDKKVIVSSTSTYSSDKNNNKNNEKEWA